MPALLPIAALHRGAVTLQGELDAEELQFDLNDPCLAVRQPLRFDVVGELMGDEVLVQGALELPLDCVCVRCLEPFVLHVHLSPWSALLPLSGEDAAPRVDEAVDLTPQIREDTLLSLPQHPVCRPECGGLPSQGPVTTTPEGSSNAVRRGPSAWSVLDTLKLD